MGRDVFFHPHFQMLGIKKGQFRKQEKVQVYCNQFSKSTLQDREMDGFMCLYPMAQSNASLQLLSTKCCLVNLSSLISRTETIIVKFFAFLQPKLMMEMLSTTSFCRVEQNLKQKQVLQNMEFQKY